MRAVLLIALLSVCGCATIDEVRDFAKEGKETAKVVREEIPPLRAAIEQVASKGAATIESYRLPEWVIPALTGCLVSLACAVAATVLSKRKVRSLERRLMGTK